MIRRRCRAIILSDAACDPGCTFADLGNAVAKIYIDFGVKIDFPALNIGPRETPPTATPYCAIGTITYPGSDKQGWILYIKPGYHGDEPASIRSYANEHPTFPHETTANQWFSESQFEAYRALGAHTVETICDWSAASGRPGALSFSQIKDLAEQYLARHNLSGWTSGT